MIYQKHTKKLIKRTLLLMLLPIITSCGNGDQPDYNYTEEETKQFLNEITANAKASITDLTEINKQPANEFGIVTRYPLPENRLKEYNDNDGTMVNKDDDISDFASYVFKTYELTNENNEKLQFVDNGRAVYLQEYGLWEYDKVLCQNLGITLKLDGKFKTLKGFITIEFKMPKNLNKEVKIPVAISVEDKISE
ncbi:hypothetical protein [Pedobacter xixiisoli]|uniref:Uncharacterized protein n=1 Tax=Pedobacter xixiisoli TaxID=1476464 RepID=A0A285ZUJ9_9SPHI|nr:hypothetical protein [Pedobacter xixiisoli]SOD13331.1 hypothetical protein SAMN06297358_1158 [Pedobacter xixiisoli]